MMESDGSLDDTRPLKVVVFVDADTNSNYPLYTSVLRRLLDQGHHITLFSHYQENPLLLLEKPKQSDCHNQNASHNFVLQLRLMEADAVLIITQHNIHELSFSLPRMDTFDGHTYTWHTNGMSCILLGGWISNRKVAMKVRAILASSDYPDMTRALPKPAYLNGFYEEDQSIETPGPCV